MHTTSSPFPKKLHELLQKQSTLEDQIAEITNQYNEVKSTFNNILREIFVEYYNEFSDLRKRAIQHDYVIPEIAPTAIFFEVEDFDVNDITEINFIKTEKEFIYFRALVHAHGLNIYYELSVPTRYYYSLKGDGKSGLSLMSKDIERISLELDLLDTHDEIIQQQKTEEREKKLLKLLLEKYGNPQN